MTINLTLIIQAANFFITWGMLRAFLFKPTVQVMIKHHEEKKTLRDAICKKQEILAHMQAMQRGMWQDFNDYTKLNEPHVSSITYESETLHSNAIASMAPCFSPSHLEQVADTLADELLVILVSTP